MPESLGETKRIQLEVVQFDYIINHSYVNEGKNTIHLQAIYSPQMFVLHFTYVQLGPKVFGQTYLN